jgi:hypothetical protein
MMERNQFQTLFMVYGYCIIQKDDLEETFSRMEVCVFDIFIVWKFYYQ